MERKEMVKQVFDYQKNSLDSFIDSVATIQDQAEKSLGFFLDRNPWVPEESKNAIMEWGNIYIKGREVFKQTLDEGFDRMESYFEIVSDAGKQAEQRAAKSAESFSRASESSKQESKGR